MERRRKYKTKKFQKENKYDINYYIKELEMD